MNDYKGKQIFESELADKPTGVENSTEELTAQMNFGEQTKFVPAPQQPDSTIDRDIDLEQALRPGKTRPWLISGLFAGFTGLLGWQAVDNVVVAIQAADWLGLSWSAFIAVLASMGIAAIGKELWKLRQLRHHFSVHEQCQQLQQADGMGNAMPFCEQLAKTARLTGENPHLDRWRHAINTSHSDTEVLDMYQSMVVSQQDQQAKKLVAKLSSEAAILVAISPLALADVLLVAWRSLRLIDQIANVYGVQLGYWSRIKLIKLVLLNMALAGATELAIDTSIDMLSMEVAGKVSARVGQGIGIGLLTARLGVKAMGLLRPIPWDSENAVKIAEIRQTMLGRLKAVITRKS